MSKNIIYNKNVYTTIKILAKRKYIEKNYCISCTVGSLLLPRNVGNFEKYVNFSTLNTNKICSSEADVKSEDSKSWSVLYHDLFNQINTQGLGSLSDRYIPLKSRKQKAEGETAIEFVDYCQTKIVGGNGGDGFIAMAQIFLNPNAGPSGGDGGNGGHVMLKASSKMKSLNHIPSFLIAEAGKKGRSKDCHGKSATNLIMEVPLGTILKLEGKVVAHLEEDGDIYVAARGGAGGKGNMFFATSTDQAPRIAEFGGLGELFKYSIELEIMADIGLIGFPNAGKSTLLRSVSRARPKVASYPFTTLKPHVGMVSFADLHQMAIADIPGLIKGSHNNLGLGAEFLKHIRRCGCLLYVLDASEGDPLEQLDILKDELEAYEAGLSERPHAFVLNKIDLPMAQENLPRLQKALTLPVLPVSAKMGQNLVPLLAVMRLLSEQHSKVHISKVILSDQI